MPACLVRQVICPYYKPPGFSTKNGGLFSFRSSFLKRNLWMSKLYSDISSNVTPGFLFIEKEHRTAWITFRPKQQLSSFTSPTSDANFERRFGAHPTEVLRQAQYRTRQVGKFKQTLARCTFFRRALLEVDGSRRAERVTDVVLDDPAAPYELVNCENCFRKVIERFLEEISRNGRIQED